jgi:cardiolipin synthase
LVAGVRIFEYVGGLLHTKSLTLDGKIMLIGSANMDRRSFELNYENNILFYNKELTATVVQRQESYIANSEIVTLGACPRMHLPPTLRYFHKNNARNITYMAVLIFP